MGILLGGVLRSLRSAWSQKNFPEHSRRISQKNIPGSKGHRAGVGCSWGDAAWWLSVGGNRSPLKLAYGVEMGIY